jgi:hypothetical protein
MVDSEFNALGVARGRRKAPGDVADFQIYVYTTSK